MALTKDQVAHSPGTEADLPVSQQHETETYRYYGFPYHWPGPFGPEDVARGLSHGDPHLRNTREVIGYHVHASNGEIGHVADLLVDEESWTVAYAVVDTRNFWSGKSVLVPSEWITWLSWGAAMIYVGLHRDAIRNAPHYDRRRPFGPDDERSLLAYYGRPAPSEEGAVSARRRS